MSNEAAKEKLSPFTFINAISHTKQDVLAGNVDEEEMLKQYIPHIINKGMSYFEDSILHANEMNRRPHATPKMQYRYYMASLRSRKRFSKWMKPDDEQNVKMVQRIYGCNPSVAKQYLKVLTEDQLVDLNRIINNN
jgi:hypothetical protein